MTHDKVQWGYMTRGEGGGPSRRRGLQQSSNRGLRPLTEQSCHSWGEVVGARGVVGWQTAINANANANGYALISGKQWGATNIS